jgi:D-alanyl-D-alanine endopeptidase (penicillin-binding protein 7)
MKKLLLTLLLACGLAHAEGSYALYDYEHEYFQVAANIDEVRSIASITKLFTAITIIRSGVELDEKVKVQGKANGRFPKGMLVTRMDLMKAMLISSDNLAAETLANTYPGGFTKYITDVNAYAQGMGLVNTTLVDSTGLLPGNTSNTIDLIKFIGRIKDNSIIRRIASDRNDEIKVPKGKKTLRISLHNTNPSIFVFDNILISKTGFTNAAGRCVVMLVEKNKQMYAVVILGQKNVQARTKIATDLIKAEPPKVVPMDNLPDPIEFTFPV